MSDLHVHDLLPAYALDALADEERRSVAAHLETCAICAAELRAYQQTVDQLAFAVPLREPPAHLRRAILERVHPGSVPAVSPGPLVGPKAAPPVAAAAPVSSSPTRRGAPTARSGWLAGLAAFFSARPAWALAGLLLILLLAAGNLALLAQVSELRQQRSAFSLVRLNPEPAAAGASGLVIVSPTGEFGALIVDHLPELPDEEQYQLWLIRDGRRTSGGVFSVYSSGYGVLRVSAPEPLSSYTSFGITVEPRGGSPAPTGSRVLGS